MASRAGSRTSAAALLSLLASAAALLAADSPVGKVLLTADFERDQVGAQPAGWSIFADDGNAVAVAASPTQGGANGACLKLTRAGGTVWKPMARGHIQGEGGSHLRLDFDWYLPALFEPDASALVAVLRGDGNRAVVRISIGGPGGVVVQQSPRESIALEFPVKPGEWGHMTVLSRPISLGAQGTYDITVAQGEERMIFPNIGFAQDWQGQYPTVHWHSPYFHLGAGRPGSPAEAYADGIRVLVVAEE